MWHAGKINGDRLASDILAERERKARVGLLKVWGFEQLAQNYDLAPVVGKFDADGVAAWHHSDAGGNRTHGAGDVIGKTDDARGLCAGRGLQFIECDHWARAHIGDLTFDAEILQHTFKLAGVLLQHLVADPTFVGARLLLQKLERRSLVRGVAALRLAQASVLFLL